MAKKFLINIMATHLISFSEGFTFSSLYKKRVSKYCCCICYAMYIVVDINIMKKVIFLLSMHNNA